MKPHVASGGIDGDFCNFPAISGRKRKMSQESKLLGAPCAVTQAEAEAALERIAGARSIGSSPALLSFLRYVVRETLKGQGAKLKAYTIGVGALGKPDTFAISTGSPAPASA
jgi:hypothetical protein